MGLIKSLPGEIQVHFEPDEILTENLWFEEKTVVRFDQILMYLAKDKLSKTKLKDTFTDAATIKFQDGKYVVSMSRKKGL